MKILNSLPIIFLAKFIAAISKSKKEGNVFDFKEINILKKNDPQIQWDFVNSTTIELRNIAYYTTPKDPENDFCYDAGLPPRKGHSPNEDSYIRMLVNASWYRREIWDAQRKDVYVGLSVNCDHNRSNTAWYKLFNKAIKPETEYIRFNTMVGKCERSKHKIITGVEIQTTLDNGKNIKSYNIRSVSPSVNCTHINSFKTIYIPNL